MSPFITRAVLGAAALFLLAALVTALAKPVRYLVFGEKANGTVVAIELRRGSHYPQVEYRTSSGEVRRFVGGGASSSDYQVGDAVAVRYFEANPTSGVISSSFGELWMTPSVLAGFGAFIGAVALFVRAMGAPPAMREPKQVAEVRPKPPRTLGGSVVTLSAWSMLILAMVTGAFSLRYVIFGETASGVVTAVSDSGFLRPVVEFTTRTGERRVHYGGPVADTSYSAGDRVTIRYFLDDPEAAISGFSDLWLIPTLFGVPGLLLRLIAAFMRPAAAPP